MIIVFFLIILSTIMIIISCNDDLFMNHKYLQTFFSAGAFVIAVIALFIAIFQLGGMNESLSSSDESLGVMKEQLELQVNESIKTTKLLNQTLFESRKMDFDRHTYGGIYIWDNKSTNESNINEKNWTENVTITFGNNFSYIVLKDVDVFIEFNMGKFNNFSFNPKFGISSMENNSIEFPFNATRIVWESLGANENISITFKLYWSRDLFDTSSISPSDYSIKVEARGDGYTIKELPIFYKRP